MAQPPPFLYGYSFSGQSPQRFQAPPFPQLSQPNSLQQQSLLSMPPSGSFLPPEALESIRNDRLRFQIELEFVQCLANPHYLNFLAQRDFLNDPAFVNYLKYLCYWKQPEYAKYLKYPTCLALLDLLQHAEFRAAMSQRETARFVDDQLVLQWLHSTRRRTQLLERFASPAAPTATGTPNGSYNGSSGKL